jgi:hypothetical protein
MPLRKESLIKAKPLQQGSLSHGRGELRLDFAGLHSLRRGNDGLEFASSSVDWD